MPSDIIDIEEAMPHEVAEVLCLCGHRWIAVFPEKTLLKDLECPNCHKTGRVFKTGQNMEQEDRI